MSNGKAPPDADEGFSEADRKRVRKFKLFMARQGYQLGPHGFWVTPGSTIETGSHHDINDNSTED